MPVTKHQPEPAATTSGAATDATLAAELPTQLRWRDRLRKHPVRCAAAWLFPIALFLAATLYLGGALGKNIDDYDLNLRDPLTGGLPKGFHPFMEVTHFIRPLHLFMLYGLGTLFDTWDRSLHVYVAVMHGLASLGIFAVLRRACERTLPAALAALLFMATPFHHEVAFWFSTTSTAIGVALMMLCMLITMRWMKQPRVGLRVPIAIFGLTFATTCFYEQSASIVAAIGAICMAAAPSAMPWAKRLWRAVIATSLGGTACIVYMLLLRGTAPQTARGGSQSFVTRDRLVARASEILSGVEYQLIGLRAEHLVKGSLIEGWRVVSTPVGVAWAGILLACAVLWLIWCLRSHRDEYVRTPASGSRSQPDASLSQCTSRSCWMALFGLGIFVIAWLPVYVIDRQIIENRNTYVPLVGIAIVVGVGLDGLLRGLRRLPGRLRPAAVSALVLGTFAVTITGAIGLIGYQSCFQKRYQLDQKSLAQLKDLVPNPPQGAVFMTMWTSDRATNTGYDLFDRDLFGVFETPWSATWVLQQKYRRIDLGITHFNPYASLPLDNANTESVRHQTPISIALPSDPRGGVRIAWDTAIPFIIARDGGVRLVPRLIVESDDLRDFEVRPPLVQTILNERPDAPITGTRRLKGESRGQRTPLTGWQIAPRQMHDTAPAISSSTGVVISTSPVQFWNRTYDASWLHSIGAQPAMEIQLPPAPVPRRLLLRATMSDEHLARPDYRGIQDLVVSLLGSTPQDAVVLGRLDLDPVLIRQQRGWVPLAVNVPPGESEMKIRVSCVQRTPPEWNGEALPYPPPIWVTSGWLEVPDVSPATDGNLPKQ